MDASHAANIHISDRTIDSHIRNIRAKLAEAGCDRRDRNSAWRRLPARAMRRVSRCMTPRDKWRPRIGLVVLAILLTVMALPLVGLFFFRIYENQLVRQTEAELIAQGAAIGRSMRARCEAAALPPESSAAGRRGSGRAQTPAAIHDDDGRYRPIEPKLDLAVDPILEPRPDPRRRTPDPQFAAIGARLCRDHRRHAAITLAGLPAARSQAAW